MCHHCLKWIVIGANVATVAIGIVFTIDTIGVIVTIGTIIILWYQW